MNVGKAVQELYGYTYQSGINHKLNANVSAYSRSYILVPPEV